MRYDPRTMRRLAMNLVVDELDRPIAFEAANKTLYPIPRLEEDSSGNVTGLVGRDGTAGFVDAGLLGASPSASAAVNAAAIQEALSVGGHVRISTPGVYSVGDANTSDSEVCIYIDSDTHLEIASGVQLKRTVGDKTLFCNRNWKSNKTTLSSLAFAYDTPIAGIVTMTVNTGSSAHGLVPGDYVYIKNDTSEQHNGVFLVRSIDNSDTNNRKFSVYRYGRNAGVPFTTFSGTAICYKADANIVIDGEGLIDYDNKGETNPLALMGSILNKIGHSRVTVRTTNAVKYGFYIGNAVNVEMRASNTNSPSAAFQIIGPCWDMHFLKNFGEASDDPYAVTTSNAGYTDYDLLDTDTTKNSDGAVRNLTIDAINISHSKTRNVLLAASNDGDLYNVRIGSIQSGPGVISPALQCGVPTGHTGAIRGLYVGPVQAAVGQTTEPLIKLVEGGTGTLNIYNAHIDSISTYAAPGTDGGRVPVVKTDAKAGTVELSIGTLDVLADAGGAATVNLILLEGAGPHYLSIGTYRVRSVNSTRTIMGVHPNGYTTPGTTQIGRFIGIGDRIQPWNAASVLQNGNKLQIGSLYLKGANVAAMQADKRFVAHFGAIEHESSSGLACFNIYGGTGSKLFVGTVNSTDNLFENQADTNLTLSVGGGQVAGIGTVTGAFSLAGPTHAIGLSIDGDNIHATVGNHAPGASFYNSDVAWGSGVGEYVRGASGWVRVAA